MRTLFRSLSAPPRPINLADEFWDQLHAIPRSEAEVKNRHATWMLHHPIDVALDITHRHLKGITSADDQLKAFVEFWVPTDAERRNRLLKLLTKQACWERTSWIPFSQKVQVLPARFAHNAFMFSALVATQTPHVYGHVSGRYTNAAPTASSYCKNNCRPPIVDGKWLPSEVIALTNLIKANLPPHIGLVTTVRLLRSMILTLLSPSGHLSFVIGIPAVIDNRIGFTSFYDRVPEYFEGTMEVPAWKPKERAEAPRRNAPVGPTSTGRTSAQAPDTYSIDHIDLTRIHYHGNVRQQDGMTIADVALAASIADNLVSSPHESPAFKLGRAGDDAVANDIAHGLSIADPEPCYRTPDPTPTYREPDPSPVCRDDSPSTSWGSESSSNCNVD